MGTAWWTGGVLLAAALLEVGGDAAVRTGLHAGTGWPRAGWLAAGGAVLLGYGVLVNAAPGSFGRSLGVYAALFLLVAQAMDWFAFGNRPGTAVLVGGGLVAAGGVVMAAWR